MAQYRIPLSKPALTVKDRQELLKCYDSTWISSKSPWVEQFEKEFAKKISQTKYAVAVNSGTSALFLALKALGIGEGNEVILPTFTMIATINAVTWVGAKPVLVDCRSEKDWNMSVSEIEKKINKKTRAIIPVHVYGYVCQMDKILKLAKKYRLFVIEDAAEAMGSTFNDRNCGSFGDLSCFSLYSNKIITTGNGGVVATNSSKNYLLIKQLSFFDFNPKHHFLHHKIGYNLVLSGLQAALGVSQVRRFDLLLKKRQLVFSLYQKNLKQNNEVGFILPSADQKPNYWFPAAIFNHQITKKRVVSALTKHRVETRDFFLPLNLQPVYKNYFKNEKYPLADYFFDRGLLLPSYFNLSQKKIKYICDLINQYSN